MIVKRKGGYNHHAAQNTAGTDVSRKAGSRKKGSCKYQKNKQHGFCIMSDIIQVFQDKAFHLSFSPFTYRSRISSIVASSTMAFL